MANPSIRDATVPISDLEMAKLPIPGVIKPTKDTDPFLVAFNQPTDPDNPLDWPRSRKWMVTDVLSATGFNRIMVSTMMAPALPTIARELNMSASESTMALSIYLLSTAFGPLFIAPLSEIYGRQVILHSSSAWFLIWNLVCGFAHTKGTLIASRFLAGFGASAIYALGGGVLGDMWRPEERGRSLGNYLLVTLLAVAVGPIIGGFIVAHTTWRWMFWATSIFQASMMFVSFFSFHESCGTLILRRRAERLRKQTGDRRYYTEDERLHGKSSPMTILGRALTRPLRLLIFHPIIQVTAVLSGFSYGILYIILSTFAQVWLDKYHETLQISGLHYIACSLGEIAGSLIVGYVMDEWYKRRQARDPTPESRIPLMYFGIIPTCAGMLMYGWTAEYRVYWFAVDVGVFIMLFGMQLSSMITTAYVIDSYGQHTSSAMAATQFIKGLTAFLFPLFAPKMYQVLGYGWSNTMLAVVGVALAIPLPLFLWKCGAKLRAKAVSTY